MFAIKKITWSGSFQRINQIESSIRAVSNLFANRYRVNCGNNDVGLRFASRGRRNTTEETLVKLACQTFEKQDHSYENEEAPIIIMHGLLGSKNNWTSTAKNILKATKNRRIISIDARNHGDSPHTKEFSYLLLVSDLIKFMAERRLEKASFIGHSMGGRVLMLLAMMYPSMVQSMVVVDISPFHSSPNMFDLKKLFLTLKNLGVDPDLPVSEARALATAELGFAIADIKLIQFLVSNIVENGHQSSWRWRFNLDSIMKNFESEMFSLPLIRPTYDGRALFIAGKKSDYLRPEDEAEIKDLFEGAEFVYVEDAGHWVHADSPEDFVTLVSDFFNGDVFFRHMK